MKASQLSAIIEAWAWRPGDPVAPDVDDTHPQAGPKYSCKRDLPESALSAIMPVRAKDSLLGIGVCAEDFPIASLPVCPEHWN